MKSSSYARLRGVLSVIPTPFHPHGDLDEVGLRATVDFAIRNGAGGVCSPMFASEFYKLSESEIRTVTRLVVEQTAGRVPVIAQCNHTSLRGVIDRARYAESIGADWIGVLVPCAFPIRPVDIERFFIEICRSTRLPVIAQDADYAGGVLPPQALVNLCRKIPNFRGVKLEGALNGPKFEMLRKETRGKLTLTSGWAGLDIFDAVARGVDGVVPGTAMIQAHVKCWNAFKRGQRERGFRALAAFMPLSNFMMQNLEVLHQVEKYLLVRQGVISSAQVREPTRLLDPEYQRQTKQMADFYFKALKKI